jgi:hypothetical protein
MRQEPQDNDDDARALSILSLSHGSAHGPRETPKCVGARAGNSRRRAMSMTMGGLVPDLVLKGYRRYLSGVVGVPDLIPKKEIEGWTNR